MKNFISTLICCCILLACNEQKGSEEFETACDEMDAVDLEMTKMVNKISNLHEGIFKKRLEMSQVYWRQYRNRHLRALYPEDWKRVYAKEVGSEVFNQCKCKEITRMTKNRIKELEMFFEGGPYDQQECPNTWNK